MVTVDDDPIERRREQPKCKVQLFFFEHVNLHVQTCDFFLCFSWFPGFQGAGSLIQYLTE